MPHWRKGHESESSTLRSADLYDERGSAKSGRDTYHSPIVIIEKVTIGQLKSREKPKGEKRNFCHFRGKDKALALNVTNCETLESLFGSADTAAWHGKTIQLYVDTHARYPSGKKGPAIRIRPEIPSGAADTKPLEEISPDARERLDREREERLAEREPGSDDQ